MDYLACGNVVIDRMENRQGEAELPQLGGPAFFALTGMRLWSENCKLACRAGLDFDETFGAWLDRHAVAKDAVRVEDEHCVQHIVRPKDAHSFAWTSVYGSEHLGYLKVTPELIDEATDYDTRGVYIVQNEDKVFWRKLYEIKTRKGFKILWELEDHHAEKHADKYRRLLDVVNMVDMISVKYSEAAKMLGIAQRDEDAIVAALQKLPVDMILLRMGSQGSWVITPEKAVHCEAIELPDSADPLGCGSTASGAALVAHCEGANPAMTAVMANIAAGYNAAQAGPIPHISSERMRQARENADYYYKKATGRIK